MADNKYCSTCFKTGEELDAALQKALVCDDNAERAEVARKAIEDMEVFAVGLTEGEQPTVKKNEENGVITLTFGLPSAPVKGTDYWTEADQQAIVDDVLAVLPSSLPSVTPEDNGKLLQVVDGTWAAVTLPNAEEASF